MNLKETISLKKIENLISFIQQFMNLNMFSCSLFFWQSL